ncbi:MAG: decarboxylating NADP(+)-dependent phosphogluconate dehydrogenase [Limosilactobacillus oris]|jgi:6-phosphogluconate dehydrogenase|uniref:decarboxylating NADP(+)-dependent phosphogluconate dehydrogenase n=1 Tax=Megasphaera sp. TaxID=2023260 RepID=UPI0025BBA554|nr:decarboxylating NADP(+)-dependent phosphogluconate dehydrogenase [Megasphaera sp.]MCH3903118.1 decarboxylating NADP(+)-dependent phosphogluconate dehydrogenase [Limosilactobacillus oris]MCH3931819.1 decarboxylating NADP(+)-dependent phosphogluconate dehydrogenase [Megasphaera sp.]MCI1887692.1 decarboxylating NADP(+)-dependent phosphogluconate dehydrogenase [Sporolactobacillus sp.]MCI1904926.1 decarboxylating NADP(+)-dependent phosphogluconate dehydrogenase [Enterococcaceae bacterium]
MALHDIGVVGMAVMGSNLALNMADHGYDVSVYNYTPDLTEQFLQERPHEKITGYFELKDFLASLKRPRKVMLMIMAGAPVDSMLDQLLPLLDTGDIIIDGGNSYFGATRRRYDRCREDGIHFYGMGISGGETGARRGPAIMLGGNKETYPEIQPIYEAIAAKAADGKPCCTYIGEDGAGHYVKMVHNGIEYADMQLIAEAYLLLKYVGGYDNAAISKIFHEWNQGELKSFLIGIAADIFAEDDEAGGQVLDKIVDAAGQKGTGRWTSIESMKQGVDISMITAACNARVMSNALGRAKAQACIEMPALSHQHGDDFVEAVRQSLYAAKIVAYAQGFSLYKSASETYDWHLDYGAIASIFRAGCIIQAEFLTKITEAYDKNPDLDNLLFDDFFLAKINANQGALRQIIGLAIANGLPIPAFSAALQYLDAYSSPQVGANLIQALRDYFGAHTFQRVDKEGTFHHHWHEHYTK